MKRIKIDVHIHLAGTGCNCSGCWISQDFKKRYTFRALKLIHKISNQQLEEDFDQSWAQKISSLVGQSSVDFGVVLGFDGVFDPGSGHLTESDSQMMIPSQWVFDICNKFTNLLPGPSINPYAEDAFDKLDFCIDNKAVLIKWLPSAQSIDPSDQRLDKFYQKLAAARIPLLVHCGGERTFKSIQPEFNDVNRLERPLNHGVKVICAHTATPVLGSGEISQIRDLKTLLGKFENLWVDNSGICNPSRFAHLPKIASDPLLESRTLYGSDWPVPSNAFYYVSKLGLKKVIELERTKNWISRDVKIKESFGYSPSTLTRAGHVLANLSHWTSRDET